MIFRYFIKSGFYALMAFGVLACSQLSDEVDQLDTEKHAVAVIRPVSSDSVYGVIRFAESVSGIKISLDIHGLSPGKHGIHLHTYGGFEVQDSVRAAMIYDPHDNPHSGPSKRDHQLGDWGNITADEAGRAQKEWIDIDLSFSGRYSILGRSVVIHEHEDDLLTQPDGGVGRAVAAGTIGRTAPMKSE